MRSRFGVLPNFFCTAASAPGLIQRLWGFTKAGYLDNPLPSLFKERLFVHLSRFCENRYCIVRHVEGALFDALTIMFIDPRGAERARLAITQAVGESTFEILTAFLAFVRTAHYWTETHPTLAYEADMVAMMRDHPALARLMLDTSEAEWAHSRRARP